MSGKRYDQKTLRTHYARKALQTENFTNRKHYERKTL